MGRRETSRYRRVGVFSLTLLFLAAAATAAEPPTDSSTDLAAMAQHLETVKRLHGDVCTQTAALRDASARLLRLYDQIVTGGPGPDRDVLVRSYQRERPAVIAQKVNLDTAVHKSEQAILRARDFLLDNRNAPYRSQPVYRELHALLPTALTAVEESRRISHPPPLPEALPDAALPGVERVDVRYANASVTVGVRNQLEVEVKSNYQFSKQEVTVEVRVRAGRATIHDALRKTVVLGPRETRVLTWGFTPDAEGDLRIGARIANTGGSASGR